MRIGIRVKRKTIEIDEWETIEKAVGHKYIRRIPKPTGKGWYYIYKETFQKPIKALSSFFGITETRLSNDYEKNNIKKQYNVDKQTFAAHVLEFFSNRKRWEGFFSKKETRDALKTPVKQKDIKPEQSEVIGEDDQKELFAEKKKDKGNKNVLNRSLMRKVWTMYSTNGRQVEQAEKDDKLIDEAESKKNRSDAMLGNQNAKKNIANTENSGDTKNKETKDEGNSNRAGRHRLSGDSGNIRSGERKTDSDTNVLEAGAGSNGDEFIQQPREFGVGLGVSTTTGSGRNLLGRVTKGQAKSIRKQCREILESKTNEEITEEDKAILRQYEGAGGLKEGDQSDVAVLSEFYTPRDVIGKMWELVDKYKPGNKKTIEPSSGIGRFAEGRDSDTFTMCELDETSSRIASILHPDAEVRPGAFQNLFMKNNYITGYEGEKFDVAIGNPPYGEYTGLYKGMGEGKDHTRYEEYFIDRSLDTLKDGGILAFIVPSGFLRGKDSKAKQIIAEKGKLLEAWRLPKGTFSSTDVGTDIVLIKKDKGNIKDYTNNDYFKQNENHVIGHETDGGNWGTKIINLPEGKTVEEAVQMIDVNAVNAKQEAKEIARKVEVKEDTGITNKRYTITGEIKEGAEVVATNGAKGKITGVLDNGNISFSFEDGRAGRLPISSFHVSTDKKTEAEISEKLSEAMKGNQNAKKAFRKTVRKKAREGDVFQPSIGKNQTAEEFNIKYSKQVPQEDMKFWRVTNWEGKVETSKLTQEQTKELESNSNFLKDENGDWVNVANYASGNIHHKLESLERHKESLSEEEYKRNKAVLEAVLPKRKKIDNFTISPIANFARLHKDENGASLVDRFVEWAGFRSRGFYGHGSPITESMLDEGITHQDVWAYINQEPVRAERARWGVSKEQQAMLREKKVQGRRESAERIFNDWLKNLSKDEIKHIESEWNAQFNSIVNPDASKIPLFVEGMNTHKGKKEFNMTEQQVKGAARLCNKGNGILAYDVGVGKAQPLDARIYTPDGYSTMGDIKVGDFVIGIDGKQTKVIGVYPKGKRDVYKVTFSDGSSTECCKEHLWTVSGLGGKDQWETKELHELQSNLVDEQGNLKLSVPTTKPVVFNKRKVKIDPHRLGSLLKCEKHYAKSRKKEKEALDSYGLRKNLYKDSFIPEDYKYNSIKNRVMLLKGLFDKAGHYYYSIKNAVVFRTESERLINDIEEVINSLGGIVDKWSTGLNWFIHFDLDFFNPFGYKCVEYNRISECKPARFIKSIEYAGKKETQCIMVEHEDHLYLTDNFIATHNTVTGIVATVSQMQSGRTKKPLVCVPKAVYKKWVKEVKQFFPEIKVNELHNLNVRVQEGLRNKDGELELQEGYLNVCTYEALQKITFKQETIDGALRDDILETQTVYDYDENGRLIDDKRSDRQKAQANEKMMKMLGMSAKAKKDAVFWEDLGIDHITVDELHNFKNIFMVPRSYGSSVRSSEDGKTGAVANEYSGIAGATSANGMKMFAISQLIQRENNGEGFFGLTATPFNNSPVEIYNILSLLARNRLKELKIYNLQDFLREYAEMKPDWKVDARGDVVTAQVMKNFKNLSALQSLITEFIDKVDGEEAGVLRPYKRVHLPMLDLTPLQKAIIAAETDRMDGKFRKGDDDGRSNADMFIALNNMRMATLSPSLVNEKYFADYAGYEGWRKPKLEDIVKESPKLQFVCDTAVTLLKEKPKEGQLIYMPRGVEQYNHVKDYLVSKGVPADAIAFMNSSTTLDQKETIKNDFNNPDGKIKIIIGSETVKEGVSLNGNSITTYNTMLGWNPTEVTQVDGRVHRQGNKQGVVHSVFPLMNDSIDSMMYQKYDEKSSRLNALWSYKGDSLNVEDIDPEEMKYALIKDPAKRANMKILKDQADLQKEKKLNDALFDNLSMSGSTYRKNERIIENLTSKHNIEYFDELRTEKEATLKERQDKLKEVKAGYKKWKEENPNEPYWKDPLGAAERDVEDAKHSLEMTRSQIRNNNRDVKNAEREIERVKTLWERYQIKDTESLDVKLSEISESSKAISDKIKAIEDSRSDLIEEARKQIAEEQARLKSYTVQDRVDTYSKEILGDLRPFANVKSAIEIIRGYSKKQIQGLIDEVKETGRASVGDDMFTEKDIVELNRFKDKAVLEKAMLVMKGNKVYFVRKHFKKETL